ncbi:urease accessory protein UreE [Geitlerinema sp. P-1104]|uniref:urease accessory protein UreE n=1 Tax=Geitlerinema sp. P-1104 TaxID=2546230 RepID=UPI0014773C0F|nr:urease accessory protein UreE [Geitlerinema sp. P-1104]NMG60803.1 urease accessory protein UreE [Geitlerinema sp. P-1104]
MSIVFTQRVSCDDPLRASLDGEERLYLSLTAQERQRSRHRFITDSGEVVFLRLPRGTILQDGDRLLDETQQQQVEIRAKPEPVLTVTATSPLLLLRAAYHLGNRHVPLEVTAEYLRLSPDPVLADLLQHLGLTVRLQTLPFQPETGAYGHHSSHSHQH